MNSQTTIFAADDPFVGRQRYQRVKPALALIGIGRSKLYSLIRAGRVRAVRLDGATFVDLASVAAMFAQCPEIAPTRHQNNISAADLGFDEPEPFPLRLGRDDLTAMAPGDSAEPAHESAASPGPKHGPAGKTNQSAPLAALENADAR